ncbi:hypothetical protein B9Q03_13685 [Candidatus Marsarchaeota G2 archaeon OSP_D]|jgi:hypothetical protein|uniref:SnoaL-like domain-containing protein n=3 Tax=Candidatus Marsarchaeota TaxID=1978152 RepID=A0A2R6C8M3_9ARCH|nr:MAG: hypothetical protein B9Q03_13685 [Candidatus Marsarchaeota G2 archaeon OSP_D]PSN87699.1 MAG: hypothetical protein B9Q00_08065 [Candidatus Marsarchaeota G1 archaeon OSP_C]PSO07231.1 MAG: hypothetical protein B9Q04_12000 [Candidatus Marsarchaeota G2 archaeon BE_D]
MASGQKAAGKESVAQLLDYFYSKAFTAQFEPRNLVVGEGKAVLEADFFGKQNMEFAGIQPSAKTCTFRYASVMTSPAAR